MSDTEENIKEIDNVDNDNSIQKPKTKRPRTEKQLQALSDAREKRRLKLEEKKAEKEKIMNDKEAIYREHRKNIKLKEARKLCDENNENKEQSSSSDESVYSSSSSDDEIIIKKKKKKPRVVVSKKKKKKHTIRYETDSSSDDDDDDNYRHTKQQPYTYPPNYHTPQTGLSSYNFA